MGQKSLRTTGLTRAVVVVIRVMIVDVLFSAMLYIICYCVIVDMSELYLLTVFCSCIHSKVLTGVISVPIFSGVLLPRASNAKVLSLLCHCQISFDYLRF